MGKVRLWIETALRDVVLLLHREAVPSATIKRVSNRLAALQRDVVDLEHLRRTKDSDGVEATEICRGVMASVLAKVLEVEIPERAVRDLEMDARILQSKIREMERERDAALRQVEEARKIEKRHSEAHMYALHCYFREVYQLRQAIQHPSNAGFAAGSPHSTHGPASAAPVSGGGGGGTFFPPMGSLMTEKSMGVSLLTSVLGDNTTFNVNPSSHRTSVATSGMKQLPIDISNPLDQSGEGGPPSVTSNASSSKTAAPPLLIPTRSMRFPKQGNGPQVDAETAAALLSVQQLYCTDAIFDYETYLDLQRSDELGWEGKYHQLKETYEGFQQQVDRDKAAALKAHTDDIRRERDKYEQLQLKLQQQIAKTKMIQLLVSAHARDYRQQLSDLREQLNKSRAGMLEAMRQLNIQVSSLSDYNQVLVDFVKAASKYMGEMTHSYFATGSGGNNTVEELTRFRFQRSLVPAPTDSVNQREAKLYWRRHELSNVLFSTIMEQRQVHEERVTAMATAQELKGVVVRLQNENAELLQNTGYAFAGVNRLLDAAALEAEQFVNRFGASGTTGHLITSSTYNGVGDLVDRRPTEAIDLPLTIVAVPSAGPSSASHLSRSQIGAKNPTSIVTSSLFLELPRSTAWLAGRQWKGAVAPIMADYRRLENKEQNLNDRDQDASSVSVLHNTYLRPKFNENEVESQFQNDRLFLHRLFACARDPHYYMRDGDRDVILTAWRRHTHLVHERNKSVFQRILVRSMHSTLTTFTNDMVADIVKRGILEMGTAAMTRSDVLQWRESIEQLREFNVRMDFNHVEKRQHAAKAIDANIRHLFRTVERTVVDQIRGIFPPPKLRAHGVPLNGKDVPDSASDVLSNGGKNGPGMVRTKSGRFVKAELRRPTAGRLNASGVFMQDSIDWRSSGMDCAATQTDISGDVAAPVDRRAGRAGARGGAGQDNRPSRIALMQTTGQFATISEQDDEASEFFRVESLQPPRCIAVPTSGGIGVEHLNHMSIKLLTRTSLMTTIPSMRQAIEDTQQSLVAATSAPKGLHHTPMLTLRQASAGAARRPDTAGSVVSSGSRSAGRLPSATMMRGPLSGNHNLLVAPPTSPRVGSAANRPPAVARALSPTSPSPSSSARTSSASRRIGLVPPAVYSTLTAPTTTALPSPQKSSP